MRELSGAQRKNPTTPLATSAPDTFMLPPPAGSEL